MLGFEIVPVSILSAILIPWHDTNSKFVIHGQERKERTADLRLAQDHFHQ